MTERDATPGFIARYLTVISLAWGSSFLLMKVMAGTVDPSIIAGVRAVVAALAIGAWLGISGQSLVPRREELVPWLILGTFAGVVPNVLAAIALIYLDTVATALIQSSSPLMTALGAHLAFQDERLSPRRGLGVAMGFFGVAMLIGPNMQEGGNTLIGVAAMLTVALCYAATNVYIKTIPPMRAERLAFGQQTVSGLLGVALAGALVGQAGFAASVPYSWHLLALGLWATALPMALFMRLIRAAGPTRAAVTGYTVPTVAAFIGVVVLGERLGPWQIAGAFVALAGVALVTTSRPRTAS